MDAQTARAVSLATRDGFRLGAGSEPGAAAQMSAPGRPGDPNKSRRQSVMPLPPGALARRASMAAGAGGARTARPGGAENAPPKSTLDRDRFGVRR